MQAKVDYDAVVHKVVEGIGVTSYADDLNRVSNMDLLDKTCEMLTRANKQNPDVA